MDDQEFAFTNCPIVNDVDLISKIDKGGALKPAGVTGVDQKVGLAPDCAEDRIDRMLDVHMRFKDVLDQSGMEKIIRGATLTLVQTAITGNAALLRPAPPFEPKNTVIKGKRSF